MHLILLDRHPVVIRGLIEVQGHCRGGARAESRSWRRVRCARRSQVGDRGPVGEAVHVGYSVPEAVEVASLDVRYCQLAQVGCVEDRGEIALLTVVHL